MTLRIIIVSTVEEAQRVVEALRAGEDFAALAKKVSIDPTANHGGLLGTLAPSALRQEVRDAIEGLRPGQISAVVPVPTGFAVFEVVAPEEAGEAPANASVVSAAVAAPGSVKYVLGVSGYSEELAGLRDFPKPPDWNLDPRTVCELRTQSVAAALASLERALRPDAAGAGLSRPERMDTHYALGQLYAYQGRMDKTIDHFQKAQQIVAADAASDTDAADLAIRLEQALGVAHLHKAEMDNGIYHRPGARCLFSSRGVQPLAKTGDSAKAVEHFLKYLAHRPAELEVKWLLNLAYMTLGGYPDQVPPAHLIPPAAFAAADDIGRFVDVAPDVGLTSVATAGGLIVDDFDNDGRFDVATSSREPCGPMRFFVRTRQGTFAERAAAAGLGGQVGALNMVSTDYNNDGCLDILMLRGGWDVPQRKSLLRNNCNGTFTDVTDVSGLARPVTSTQTAVWTDIDNDGLLDVFVGNENTAAQLFVNNGDGTFTDIAQAAGVARTAFSKAVVAADYDNDGWPDLYVSNFSGRNFLYRNRHDRTFEEVGEAAGVPGPGKGFTAWFFDYDNDGWPDLLANSYFTSVDESVRTYLGLPHAATPLKLYRNRRDGRFEDVTRQMGLEKVFMPMGSNFGDIDNDGYLDIYLGMGNPSYASTLPSVLLRNKDGQAFVDVTASSGTGELHKGHGVGFADLDNDGDDDLLNEVGGATPGDAHALRLFENPGHGRDWITLKLVGVKTNRAALGARITVHVEAEGDVKRTIHRTVSTGGSFGVSPLAQHIGLGKGIRSVDVDIWWPTSNTRQHFANVARNHAFEVREFASEMTALERPGLPLGGSKSRDEARNR